MSFLKPSQDLFFSRNDSSDPRLGELARHAQTFAPVEKQSAAFAIVGYPDDEGIRINGGRPGAAEAPDRIRKFLYKMTPSALSSAQPQINDLGNLAVESISDLKARHEACEKNALNVFKNGGRLISLGGGHDYGYPDTAAFAAYCKAQNAKPLVINFDAHLDVRPTSKGLSSGTPFFRLLEAYPEIDFVEVGVQAHCNSKSHLEWAQSKGAHLLRLEEIRASGESLSTYFTRKLEPLLIRPRPAFISLDIDGFSSAYAMGCSQSWATGFAPDEFFQLLQILCARLDVRGLGIYEVSPPLDSDDRTSKLAALVAHRFLYPL